jgi:tRNA(fMet)-specific endonuclease VapC
MKPALIDTDILSMFFRNDVKVVSRFKEYLKFHNCINISIITYYEILSGLKYKNAAKQIDPFLMFVELNNLLPLTKESIAISSDRYACLRNKGKLVDR